MKRNKITAKYPRYLGVRISPRQEKAVVEAANRESTSACGVIRELIDRYLVGGEK